MPVYELAPSDFYSAKTAFAHVRVERSAIDSILDGQRKGRVFVDDPYHPTAAMLCHHVGNYYLAGDVSDDLLRFIREAPEEVGIFSAPFFNYYPLDSVWDSALLTDAPDFILVTPRTILILEDCADSPYRNWRDSLPAGAEVLPIDRELAERVDRELSEQYIGPVWYEDGIPAERYPAEGYENFARKSFGYVMLIGGKLVAAAWAGSLSDGAISIEIETSDGFRGRGFATLIGAAVIEACGERHLTSEWICDVSNPASKRVAEHLGHIEVMPINRITWRDWGQDIQSSRGLWSSEPHDVGTIWRRRGL